MGLKERCLEDNGCARVGALNWVRWFNQTRLLEPINHIPPAQFEALYERGQQESSAVA